MKCHGTGNLIHLTHMTCHQVWSKLNILWQLTDRSSSPDVFPSSPSSPTNPKSCPSPNQLIWSRRRRPSRARSKPSRCSRCYPQASGISRRSWDTKSYGILLISKLSSDIVFICHLCIYQLTSFQSCLSKLLPSIERLRKFSPKQTKRSKDSFKNFSNQIWPWLWDSVAQK